MHLHFVYDCLLMPTRQSSKRTGSQSHPRAASNTGQSSPHKSKRIYISSSPITFIPQLALRHRQRGEYCRDRHEGSCSRRAYRCRANLEKTSVSQRSRVDSRLLKRRPQFKTLRLPNDKSVANALTIAPRVERLRRDVVDAYRAFDAFSLD